MVILYLKKAGWRGLGAQSMGGGSYLKLVPEPAPRLEPKPLSIRIPCVKFVLSPFALLHVSSMRHDTFIATLMTQ